MTHDDYVAENGDDVSVEVFSVIELDMSNRSDSTEHCWLTWDQLDATQAWDYTPCVCPWWLVCHPMSWTMQAHAATPLYQLNEFISSVYYRKHAFIDCDDYVMHAFRIPKPKNSDSYDASKDDLKEWMELTFPLNHEQERTTRQANRLGISDERSRCTPRGLRALKVA